MLTSGSECGVSLAALADVLIAEMPPYVGAAVTGMSRDRPAEVATAQTIGFVLRAGIFHDSPPLGVMRLGARSPAVGAVAAHEITLPETFLTPLVEYLPCNDLVTVGSHWDLR